MADQCKDFFESADGLVVMAFDLVHSEAKLAPQRIAAALRDKDVQGAITKALESEAKRLLEQQKKEGHELAGSPQQVSGKEAEDIALRLAEKALEALKADVQRQIEQSPRAVALKKKRDEVVDAFKCSPVGVWLDENKNILYVVGAVLALGGAAGMYILHEGDPVAKFLEGKSLATKLGAIELKGEVVQFRPKEEKLQLVFSGLADLKVIKTELKLKGLLAGPYGVLGADGSVTMPLGSQFTAVASGGFAWNFDLPVPSPFSRVQALPPRPKDYRVFNYDASLRLGYKADGLSVDLVAALKDDKFSGSLKSSYSRESGPYRWGAGSVFSYGPDAYSAGGNIFLSRPGGLLPFDLKMQGEGGQKNLPDIGPQKYFSIFGALEATF